MVGLREYQDAKADVIMKYNSDEARRLKNMGQLPDTVNVRIFISKNFYFEFFFQKSFQIEFGLTDDNDIVFENDDSDYDENEIAPQPYQPEIRYFEKSKYSNSTKIKLK